MALYKIYNFAQPTTTAPTPVATGTSLKTMLQIVPSATNSVKVKEYCISMDASAAATPGTVELIETDVAATVTAHVASGIVKMDAQALVNGDPTTNLIQVGTALTGYTASAEGSITAARELDAQQIPPTNQFVYQWVLGNEGIIQPGKFGRIRVKFAATVNMFCWATVEV